MDAELFIRRFDDLVEERNFTAARILMSQASDRQTTAVMAHYARGVLAMFDHDLELADREMITVLNASPDYAPAHHNRGSIAQWRQDYEASVRHFRRAVALNPAARDSAVSLGHSLFALGRYPEGWNHLASRQGGLAQRPRPRGLWDGTPLPGRALVVTGEEGLGDVLQFVRYVTTIRERVDKLYLLTDGQFAGLASLLVSLPGIDAIVTDRTSGPPIHAYCPIMTLAQICHASLDNPGSTPYLRADAERIAAWRSRIDESTKRFAAATSNRGRLPRQVGLVWAGNARQSVAASDIDSRRSIDPALLERLATIDGIEWHTLQMGEAAKKIGRLSPRFAIHDLTAEIKDFADTAAYIANLDLTITVDTSVAHLAGAIGAPVWMLNRFDTCWRWGGNTCGARTPWYASMRIFRQPAFGDWPSVVTEVEQALGVWQSTFSR
jgi:hypothetical protein